MTWLGVISLAMLLFMQIDTILQVREAPPAILLILISLLPILYTTLTLFGVNPYALGVVSVVFASILLAFFVIILMALAIEDYLSAKSALELVGQVISLILSLVYMSIAI